jgi:RHS repeat-associated protein
VIDPIRSARGTVVWRWELSGEAFGNDKPIEDPDGDNVLFVLDMRYPGQQYDSASGFNYNYFRDYDPSVGRYVQSDPIGLGGGISTYGYVGGNPMFGIDPLGLVEPSLELYVSGVIDRMPIRRWFGPAEPMERGKPDKVPDSCVLSRNCAPGKPRFDTVEGAVRTVLTQNIERSSDIDIETCGLVCRDRSSGKYFLGDQTWWTASACPPGYRQCPACSSQAAAWHTHGAPASFLSPLRAEYFSPDDIRISNETGLPIYLGTPQWYLRHYSPVTSQQTHLGPLK